jgi:hypothetical protein
MSNQDEQYEPEAIQDVDEVNIRMHAATVAASIPWNPSEPITEAGIRSRFSLVYEFIRNGTTE